MLIDLLPVRRKYRDAIYAKRSLPFVEPIRGNYAHRVRSVAYYTSNSASRPPHAAVKCWCGQTILVGGRRDGAHLVADVTLPICATCEGRAIGAGQVGAREIAGRPVMYSPKGLDRFGSVIFGASSQ